MSSRSLRILLVEDAADNRFLIAAYFKRLPFHIDIAENGKVAVEKFTASGPYDLVVMDIQMPEMDGITAAQTIRSWEEARRAPRTPILALSAAIMSHDIERALEAGCDALISKPVRRSVLLAKIEEMLGTGLCASPSSPPLLPDAHRDHRFGREAQKRDRWPSARSPRR